MEYCERHKSCINYGNQLICAFCFNYSNFARIEEKKNMRILQIEEKDVIKYICDDVNVLRLKTDDFSICNLLEKTIKVIKRDMQKEDVEYLYFILVE